MLRLLGLISEGQREEADAAFSGMAAEILKS
jgi:hypothetical protein